MFGNSHTVEVTCSDMLLREKIASENADRHITHDYTPSWCHLRTVNFPSVIQLAATFMCKVIQKSNVLSMMKISSQPFPWKSVQQLRRKVYFILSSTLWFSHQRAVTREIEYLLAPLSKVSPITFFWIVVISRSNSEFKGWRNTSALRLFSQ